MGLSAFINIALGVLWLSAIGTGIYVLTTYQFAPGVLANPPQSWPVDTKIKLSADRATLVMLAHPRCPCTRASIGELAHLLARLPGKLATYVLFLSPKSMPPGWEKTDLWQSAAAMPGVTVIADIDGAEARCFHAVTSGQTMVYGTDRRLLFSGGITASRGHFGDNRGVETIVSVLNKRTFSRQPNLVFGCPLLHIEHNKQ